MNTVWACVWGADYEGAYDFELFATEEAAVTFMHQQKGSYMSDIGYWVWIKERTVNADS